MGHLLEWLSVAIIDIISQIGYWGVFILMALEGSFFPVPSEIILPFSGFLVSRGIFAIWLVALVGALGNIVGTIFTYSLSRYWGAGFLYKYGKYFFVTHEDLELAERLFKKHGAKVIFISRLIPGVRGFVPISAGVAKMKVVPFVGYVFVGSFIYSWFLTYLGFVAGQNWGFLEPYFRRYNWILLVIITAAALWWILRYIKTVKTEKEHKHKT